MSDSFDSQRQLLQNVIDGCQLEYRELSDNWRSLDSKSQGAVAISGVFLAGAFAFIREITKESPSNENSWLIAAVVLLAISVICALAALWVRTVHSVPDGETLNNCVKDLLKMDDGTSHERIANFYHDQIKLWTTTNQDIAGANWKKACCLTWAQIFLLLAIICAVIATVIRVNV